MLRLDSKNINFSGVSIIEEEQIASMSASQSGNQAYFNFNIDKLDLYIKNAELVDTDFNIFKETVFDFIIPKQDNNENTDENEE